MEIEKAPAGRLIDRLEEKGWIERRPDAADRRVNRIYLTDRGLRVHAAILPTAEATVNDALSALSSAERKQVTKLMTRVKATLTRLAEADAGIDSIDFAEIDNNSQVEERRL